MLRLTQICIIGMKIVINISSLLLARQMIPLTYFKFNRISTKTYNKFMYAITWILYCDVHIIFITLKNKMSSRKLCRLQISMKNMKIQVIQSKNAFILKFKNLIILHIKFYNTSYDFIINTRTKYFRLNCNPKNYQVFWNKFF